MANNPRHMDNLKPFKKGQSGNPKGRPKFKGINKLIEELGEDNMRDVVSNLNELALSGNIKAIQEILDRYYGKPKQHIDQEITQTIIEVNPPIDPDDE